MGTPREPLELVRVGDTTRMITTSTRVDYTNQMNDWANARVEALAREDLDGFVLKKHSPSCGVWDVKVVGASEPLAGHGRGLFASVLVKRFPQMPVEEEGRLADPRVRENFMERVLAFKRQKEPFRRVRVTRFGRRAGEPQEDLAATEEPLEVRLHGKPFAVIMRTPGSDRELAAGFLFSEGVIHSHDDLGAVEHCRHPDHPDVHNIVDVYLVGAATTRLEQHLEQRRNIMTSSSCGLCGRVTIESLRCHTPPLPIEDRIDSRIAGELPQKLRTRQSVFDETGGLHAAGLFAMDGTYCSSAEDVGRHNAVDKVVGAMLFEERVPLRQYALAVSGRASFEIVQKAWLAGIPIVCAVSAPSSLAIELADEAGITLLGFVRDGSFNLYTHAERIEGV